jgi:hypothetical protein
MIDVEKEREGVIHALTVTLKLVANGDVPVEIAAEIIADYIIALQKYEL